MIEKYFGKGKNAVLLEQVEARLIESANKAKGTTQEHYSSDSGKALLAKYKQSNMPQRCHCCERKDRPWDLYLVNNEKRGCETLHDVFPLCLLCASKVNARETQALKTRVRKYRKQLKKDGIIK
jgi:hypothetical protein